MKNCNLFSMFFRLCVISIIGIGVQTATAETFMVQFKGKGKLVKERAAMEELKRVPERFRKKLLEKDALCYPLNILDPNTGLRIGKGFDCLTDITPNDDGSITATDTTIFVFGNGTIVSVEEVTIQPNLTEDFDRVTHITGSFPKGRNIKFGTGKFRNARGRVRLSGGVNMDNFPESIVFDCFFMINTK